MCNLGSSYKPKLKTRRSALLEMTKSSSSPVIEEAQRKIKRRRLHIM